jgi:hypothetical protein
MRETPFGEYREVPVAPAARPWAREPEDVVDVILRSEVLGVKKRVGEDRPETPLRPHEEAPPPGERSNLYAFCTICRNIVGEAWGEGTLWAACPHRTRIAPKAHEDGSFTVISLTGNQRDDMVAEMMMATSIEGAKFSAHYLQKLFLLNATASTISRLVTAGGSPTFMYIEDWRAMLDTKVPGMAQLGEQVRKQCGTQIAEGKGGAYATVITAISYIQDRDAEVSTKRFRIHYGMCPQLYRTLVNIEKLKRRNATRGNPTTWNNRTERLMENQAVVATGRSILEGSKQDYEHYLMDMRAFAEEYPDLGMTTPSVEHAVQLITEAGHTHWPCMLEGPGSHIKELVHDKTKGVRRTALVVYDQLKLFEDMGYWPRAPMTTVLDIVCMAPFRVVMKNSRDILKKAVRFIFDVPSNRSEKCNV